MKWKEPLMIAGAVFLIAVAVVGYKAMTSPPSMPEGADASPPYFFITQGAHVSINAGKDAYATTLFTNYSLSKISEVKVDFTLFREQPLRRVYLLAYPRVDSPGYDEFATLLSEKLAFYGIHTSNITMEEAVYLRRSILI